MRTPVVAALMVAVLFVMTLAILLDSIPVAAAAVVLALPLARAHHDPPDR